MRVRRLAPLTISLVLSLPVPAVSQWETSTVRRVDRDVVDAWYNKLRARSWSSKVIAGHSCEDVKRYTLSSLSEDDFFRGNKVANDTVPGMVGQHFNNVHRVVILEPYVLHGPEDALHDILVHEAMHHAGFHNEVVNTDVTDCLRDDEEDEDEDQDDDDGGGNSSGGGGNGDEGTWIQTWTLTNSGWGYWTATLTLTNSLTGEVTLGEMYFCDNDPDTAFPDCPTQDQDTENQ